MGYYSKTKKSETDIFLNGGICCGPNKYLQIQKFEITIMMIY